MADKNHPPECAPGCGHTDLKTQLIDAKRLEPLDQEVTGDPLTQSILQALVKKGL
jgi:hypothetical protein